MPRQIDIITIITTIIITTIITTTIIITTILISTNQINISFTSATEYDLASATYRWLICT